MRSNYALPVNVDYLRASVAARVTRTSLRNGIHVEFQALIRALVDHAEKLDGAG